MENFAREKMLPVYTPGRISLQKLPKEILSIWTELDFLGELELISFLLHDVFEQFLEREPEKRRRSLEELVKHNPNGPKIRFGVVLAVSIDHFGSHGEGSAESGAGHFLAGLSEAEVADDDGFVVDEDVGELEVSVHDVVLAQLHESIHNLLHNFDRLGFPEVLDFVLLEIRLEVALVAVLDDKIEVVFGLHVVEQVHHVGVGDFVHDLHLCVEQLEQDWVRVDYLFK